MWFTHLSCSLHAKSYACSQIYYDFERRESAEILRGLFKRQDY